MGSPRVHGVVVATWACGWTQLSRPITIIRLPGIQAEAAELRHRAALMHMMVEAYLADRASTGSSRPHSGNRTREER